MTVHTRRTQVTLHYCSLLFHCLISQRLINMHAFPGIGHDEEIIPTSDADVRSCFKATSGDNVQRKKGAKKARSQER